MSIHLAIPDEMAQRFEEVAQSAGQSREQVMLDILAAYLAEIAAEDARIDEARAQMKRGEVVELEEIRAEDAALLARLGLSADELATIKAEVEAEADAYYGVTRCE
jgi:predicted transcriptional regulator